MSRGSLDRLLGIMARLRDPDGGCPWDREQTFATIAPHTIEEAYEVVEAIDTGDVAALKEELGDLLFQVVFYAQIAGERGLFDFDDIGAGISDKMVRRHPHVFGEARIADAEAQTAAWEDHKQRERHVKAAAAATPPSASTAFPLPSPRFPRRQAPEARRSRRLRLACPNRRAAQTDRGNRRNRPRDCRREREEARGGSRDLLFSCVNLARKLKIDPEAALRRAIESSTPASARSSKP